LLYKNISAKDVQYDPGCFAGTNSYDYELFSQDTEDYGFLLLFVKNLVEPTKKPILDFYWGFGFRLRQIHKAYQFEGTWGDKIPSERVENKSEILPTVHIGIKVGLNFAKK